MTILAWRLECGVIRHRQIEPQQAQDGTDQAFRLAQRRTENRAQPACCTDEIDAVRRPVCFNAPDLAIMPHKYNANCWHHILRPKRRVTNWSKYNEEPRIASPEMFPRRGRWLIRNVPLKHPEH